ncbi:MAG: c-type cytochrome [Flavobacteriales bacterium]|nr:c-type cytochrome [Flavobacteriales bacterium]
MNLRSLATLALATVALGATAQEPAAAPAPSPFAVDNTLLYVLGALAGIQALLVAALSGILRTLGGMGGPGNKPTRHGGRAVLAIPLLLSAAGVQAQAYTPPPAGITDQASFWWLVVLNLALFLIILLQLGWIRNLTAWAVGGAPPAPSAKAVKRPSFLAALWAKSTRQVKMEEEQAIELDHDYDGIKELDNVLPPWWVWLFYGTIAWGVLYLVNVHVIKVWPGSTEEYKQELAQAQVDIAAFQATQTNAVDENNVTLTDEAAVIAEGRTLFTANCTACHGGDASGSEFSVGPNLTDAYWLHGGGVKNIFKTIKYGVPEKGMIAWKAQLQPTEISAISSYLITLQGTGGATQKAPQGELWKEEGTAADSTAVPVDSMQVAGV